MQLVTIPHTRTRLGRFFSEGARLAWVEIERRGWTMGRVSREIGAKPGLVPNWLYGERMPRFTGAAKLRDLLGVPLDAWTLPPTCEFVPPAAREDASGPALPDNDYDDDADEPDVLGDASSITTNAKPAA